MALRSCGSHHPAAAVLPGIEQTGMAPSGRRMGAASISAGTWEVGKNVVAVQRHGRRCTMACMGILFHCHGHHQQRLVTPGHHTGSRTQR